MDSTSRIRGRRRLVVGLLTTSALAAGGGLALAGPGLTTSDLAAGSTSSSLDSSPAEVGVPGGGDGSGAGRPEGLPPTGDRIEV